MIDHSLFISDIHLQEKTPEITQKFTRFMHEIAPQAQALYILGDLFEMWVGDDDLSAFNTKIIQLIKSVSVQIPVYFIQGNRDFLLSAQFANAAGMQILPDPSVVNLYGSPVLLSHGDILCTDDQRHQRYRRIAMNQLVQRLFLSVPLIIRRKIAESIRLKSINYNRNAPTQITDVNQQAVKRVLQKHSTPLLIHGHTHRPTHYPERVVLGAWHDDADYVRYSADGTFELVKYCSETNHSKLE